MTDAQWIDRERIEEHINNHPGLVTDLLAQHFEQTELDVLYAKMFPAATPEQKRHALEQARKLLTRNGCEEDSPLIQELDAELEIVQAAIVGA